MKKIYECIVASVVIRALIPMCMVFVYGCQVVPRVSNPDERAVVGVAEQAETPYRPIFGTTYIGRDGSATFFSAIETALKNIGLESNASSFILRPDKGQMNFNFLGSLEDEQRSAFLDELLKQLGSFDDYKVSCSSNEDVRCSPGKVSERIMAVNNKNGRPDGYLSSLLSSISSVLLMNEIRSTGSTQGNGDAVATGKIIADQIRSLNPPVLEQCEDAFERRMEKFEKGVGTKRDNFGMLISDSLMPEVPSNLQEGGFWAGSMALCSWVGATKNYYHEFDFRLGSDTESINNANLPLTLVSVERLLDQSRTSTVVNGPPDNNTKDLIDSVVVELNNGLILPVKTSMEMQNWKWKLHATGDKIEPRKVIESLKMDNSTNSMIEITDDFVIDNNCFDIFFKHDPKKINGTYFHDLAGYCNGRCDEAIVNSGE